MRDSEAHVYRDGENELCYRLFRPEGEAGEGPLPLVLFLHGVGERGSDNESHLRVGTPQLSEGLAEYPCFLVAPQCPEGDLWAPLTSGDDSHDTQSEPTNALRMTLDLVGILVKDLPADPARVYLTGLSMGGFGAWDAVVRYPTRFAAAVPVCGGGDEKLAPKLSSLPLWVFHGDSDGAVNVRRSRDMVAAIREAGGSPRYTELEGVDHASWIPAYQTPELYRWLFSQSRQDD